MLISVKICKLPENLPLAKYIIICQEIIVLLIAWNVLEWPSLLFFCKLIETEFYEAFCNVFVNIMPSCWHSDNLKFSSDIKHRSGVSAGRGWGCNSKEIVLCFHCAIDEDVCYATFYNLFATGNFFVSSSRSLCRLLRSAQVAAVIPFLSLLSLLSLLLQHWKASHSMRTKTHLFNQEDLS